MRLTAEQFADLAASFHPERRKGPKQHERRRAPRMELEASIALRVVQDGKLAPPLVVRVFDFSPRGLGLFHSEPIAQGTQFVVQMERQTGGYVSMLCTVMHSRAVAGERFKIGVEFTCQLGQHPGKPTSASAIDEQMKRIRESVLE
jgi:hypothetical protein